VLVYFVRVSAMTVRREIKMLETGNWKLNSFSDHGREFGLKILRDMIST